MDLQIVQFQVETFYPGLPWLRLADQRQSSGMSSPQDTTAYHLAKLLPGRSPEYVAAYKLNACCIEYDFHGFRRNVVHPFFESHKDSAYRVEGNRLHVGSYTNAELHGP